MIIEKAQRERIESLYAQAEELQGLIQVQETALIKLKDMYKFGPASVEIAPAMGAHGSMVITDPLKAPHYISRIEDLCKKNMHDFSVLRGKFRTAVIDIMKDQMGQALLSYKFAAKELIGSWEAAAVIAEWFRVHGLESGLNPAFLGHVSVPHYAAGEAAMLDGKKAKKFACDISELLDDRGMALFSGDYWLKKHELQEKYPVLDDRPRRATATTEIDNSAPLGRH